MRPTRGSASTVARALARRRRRHAQQGLNSPAAPTVEQRQVYPRTADGIAATRKSARMCQQETLPIEIRRTRACLSATEYRSWPRADLRQLIDESEISFRRAEMR